MTVRLTVRLPESIYERLRLAGQSSGRSVNQVIVDSLRDMNFGGAAPPGAGPQGRLTWALRDTVRPWTDADDALMAGAFGEDTDTPILSHEELQAAFPPLTPPLSETVIALREDRV